MRRLVRNLVFSLVAAASILGGLELGLRVTGWPDPGLYDGDTASLWTLRRNLPPRDIPFPERGTRFSVRTNSYGYRGPEPEPGGTLCLGDSTTFGWGVEEDETWCALMGGINGGVPGYSTVQGLATIDHALTMRPRNVVIAYLVRDAELAAAPDDARRPAPSQPAILRAIRTLRGPRPPLPGNVFRVPPEHYAANVAALADRVRAAGATPWILAFPMRTPPAEHLAAIGAFAPTLPAAAFFPEDPIHLTVEGNRLLADEVREWMR